MKERDSAMPTQNIVWNWRGALFGLVLALPGAALILNGNLTLRTG
jgi:hypothetical protein